jgi:outer membrane protein TolC
MKQDVDSYVGTAISHEAAPAISPVHAGAQQAKPAEFTFSQACARAAQNDHDLASAMADVDRSQVEVAQAQSKIWPRVEFKGYYQQPIGGGTQGVPPFSGGVYFRYDLQQAIFVGDATAVARAKVAQNRENIKMKADRISQDLFTQLADREAQRVEVAQRRRILDQTTAAQERAREMGRLGRLKTEQIFEYQLQYESSSQLYQTAVRKLAEINRTICDQLLTDCTQEVMVTDLPQLISQMDALLPEPNPDMQFLQSVWNARHDSKAAEADLFMKEMAVIDEKRKRLPTLNPSIGFGNMSLNSSLSQAPAVFQFSASMPLYDFGDIKRSVAKASIDRELARQNILLLLHKIEHELSDKSSSLSEAIAIRDAVESQRNTITKKSESSQKLIEAGVIDPLDLLNLRVRAAESEIDAARARMDVSKAAAGYAYASGHSLDSGPPAQSSGAERK